MIYNLVYYGNSILREKASEVKNIDQDTINLIDTMFNIMYRSKGIGLAAPQIDVSMRILTLDLEPYKGPVMTLINPVITYSNDIEEPFEEGCLSLPGISKAINRPIEISVKAISTEGKEMYFDADGILARALQHEIDHLNGILFIDHLDNYIRKELRSELKRIKKLNK